jgi:endonuclease/exonuclease/phosphatase family metal-dependent hydrolase
MRFMTWNVWGRFGDWQQREQAIIETLASVRPDVLALQETWSTPSTTQAEILGGKLGMDATFARSRMPIDPDPDVQLGLAVLSRWPILNISRHRLSEDDRGATDALAVEIGHPDGSLHFMTACMDWEEDHGEQRRVQAQGLRSLITDPDRDGLLPVVLAGDLDAPPETPEITTLTSVATDCWAHSRREPGHTYSSANPYLGHGEWLENGRIDYVLARPGSLGGSLDVQATALAGLHAGRYPVPSDHYAVVADVTPGEPT